MFVICLVSSQPYGTLLVFEQLIAVSEVGRLCRSLIYGRNVIGAVECEPVKELAGLNWAVIFAYLHLQIDIICICAKFEGLVVIVVVLPNRVKCWAFCTKW